jgi:DUF4097 and DUF4098 domain-containing protein YvlB
VKTRYGKKWGLFGNTRGEVRYKLMAPAAVSLKKIDVVNSGIRVRNVKGYVHLDAVNGGIDASGLTAPGCFETVNGSIEVAYDRLPVTGDIALHTVNGSGRVIVPKDAAFALNADSVNGRIRCDLPVTLQKSGRHHLRGIVAAGGPRVSLESVNGSLHVDAR